MENFKLGTIFANLAEVSKQKDSGQKKVVDYTRASRTIRDYEGNIEELYDSGNLKKLSGITAGIYSIIDEYFTTGRIKIYEELKGQYSEDLIKFIRISGLGKKRMFMIYKILGVRDLKDLKKNILDKGFYKKILSGNQAGKGFITEKHLDRLLFSFKYFESTLSLYPRGYIDLALDEIKRKIMVLKDVKAVLPTGSLRRKKPFIGDVDLVVLPEFNQNGYDFERSKELLNSLLNLDFIDSIEGIDRRAENISARFISNYGVDFEVIISSDKDFILDLFYTTGCKKHVKEIEKIAASRGFFDGKKIRFSDDLAFHNDLNRSGPREIDRPVYENLGLQFIPAELREANDEVRLAYRYKLPRLVELNDIKGDLHVHSYWSDGLMDVDEIAQKAKNLNYEYIAITDHSASNVYGNGLDSARMLKKINSLNKLKKEIKDIKLLIGGEVDIRKIGRMDYEQEILERIDIVIGSIHSNYLNTAVENTMRIVSALENRAVDAIAHPTGVVFATRAPYVLDMDRIFNSAVKYNKAMEINSYFLRLDLNDMLVRDLKSRGGKFVINTDSHRIANLDMMRMGIDVARRAGLTKKDIINTMSFDELMKWKRQR